MLDPKDPKKSKIKQLQIKEPVVHGSLLQMVEYFKDLENNILFTMVELLKSVYEFNKKMLDTPKEKTTEEEKEYSIEVFVVSNLLSGAHHHLIGYLETFASILDLDITEHRNKAKDLSNEILIYTEAIRDSKKDEDKEN